MKYLLLCHFDEAAWDEIPQPQRDRIMQEYDAWIESVATSGHHRASAQLRPTSSATTIRTAKGKPFITDGPFAETKEQLGGYHLVECKDLDEALSLAKRIPTLRVGGTIEVRPVESAS